MLVKEWMSTRVITVDADDPVQDAVNLVKTHDISMLPVMREGKLVGIITDLDLKAFSLPLDSPAARECSSQIGTLKVQALMSQAPVTVPMDYTVEETADVLLKNRISGVVVVDEANRMVGVITQTDINRVMVSVTGLWRGGIVFGFLIEDRPGSIRDAADHLRKYGGRMASILTSYDRVPKGHRKVHIRARGIDRTRLPELVEEAKKQFTLLYLVDQRENRREIFQTVSG